jgi:multidrug efflux pump subunit AcrA (membrane-fusion protein)
MKNFWTLWVFILILSCREKTIHPLQGEVVEAVYGLGIIKSENHYEAKAAILSSVKEFYVTEGMNVAKGTKLFKTDQGSIYYSPFAGKVTDIPVPISQNLFPQTTILSLIDLNHLYLEVSLEQQGAMKLKEGLKAEISFEFFRNKKIIGTITSLYPKNDQFIAKVLVSQWPPGILPGMSADVAFEVARKKSVTLVPLKAVANGHILMRRDSIKKKLKVEIGLLDQEKVEIVSPKLFLTDEIILP